MSLDNFQVGPYRKQMGTPDLRTSLIVHVFNRLNHYFRFTTWLESNRELNLSLGSLSNSYPINICLLHVLFRFCFKTHSKVTTYFTNRYNQWLAHLNYSAIFSPFQKEQVRKNRHKSWIWRIPGHLWGRYFRVRPVFNGKCETKKWTKFSAHSWN